MVKRDKIVDYLNNLLSSTIEDSSSNELQVQGKERISRIGLAVDASLEAYKKAVALGCDMLLVHHGLIWNGIKYVTGPKYAHLKYLFDHDLNLYASHLPLDMHPKFGNNIQLAYLLRLQNLAPFGVYNQQKIGYKGVLLKPMRLDEISQFYKQALGGKHLLLPFGKKLIASVGIISGDAAEDLAQAIEEKLDLYITGEPAHYNHHQAKEADTNVLYLGHYASEQLGVKSVGKLLEKRFKVPCVFLDIPTIV